MSLVDHGDSSRARASDHIIRTLPLPEIPCATAGDNPAPSVAYHIPVRRGATSTSSQPSQSFTVSRQARFDN